MTRLADAFVQAVVVAVLVFTLLGGGSYLGMLLPPTRILSMALIVGAVAVWLVARWRQRWRWHATPLGAAILVWIAAFALSLLANLDSWRRIAMGLWYVGLYIALWYALYDLIANGRLKPRVVVDTLLLAGLIVVALGLFQLRDWFTEQAALLATGAFRFELPRPASVYGNPNFLASYLVVLIPFTLGRAFASRWLPRLFLIAYAVVSAFVLVLTFARGGWLGLAAGLAVQAVLGLAHVNLLHPSSWRPWWHRRARITRLALALLLLATVVFVVVAAAFTVASLRIPGRTLFLRTYIWEDALQYFGQKPLFGHGLFTFGRALLQMESIPPRQAHAHAHDLPLHVAAELGLAGLFALGLTAVLVLRRMRRNWQDAPPEHRLALAAAIAAAVGFAVHQLLDVTVMIPAMVLVGLLSVLLATFPQEGPRPLPSTRARAAGAVVVGGWALLLVTGVWSTRLYNDYFDRLSLAMGDQQYRAAADGLAPIITADPSLAVYHYQQGFLYGVAAGEGDAGALPLAIAAFERYVALEPDYAPTWANLAALYWQADRRDEALAAMQTAADRAPLAWQISLQLGRYQEQMGRLDDARESYDRALSQMPDLVLLPGWGETNLQRQLGDGTLSRGAQVALLLDRGEVSEARALWDDVRPALPESVMRRVMDAWLALKSGDRDAAVALLDEADAAVYSSDDRAWVRFGELLLAEHDGDADAIAAALASARNAAVPEPLALDFDYGLSMHHIQFLRLAVQRQFLPQANYVIISPVLFELLEARA